VKITLNGDQFEIERPVTVRALLDHLGIDPRRVAVERNLIVVKRASYDDVVVEEGDQIEIVNFVGGGQCRRGWRDARVAAELSAGGARTDRKRNI
jgi:thiazole synthase